MLQLLVTILALTLTSVSGYFMIEQFRLNQVMADQRETMRRLDVAAETIQGMAGTVPGIEGMLAPVPTVGSGDFAYSQMPQRAGGINVSPAGVPFLYCPLGAPGGSGGAIPIPGDTYQIQASNGLVVRSSIVIDGLGAQRPLAVIVAASSRSVVPPSCKGVSFRNGRPFVEGGLVRVVARSEVGSVASLGSDVADVVVGSGDGSAGAGSSTSIDSAIAFIHERRPAMMTIHVRGMLTPSAESWGKLFDALNGSGSSLVIVGETSDAGLVGAPSGGVLPAPGRLTLRNVSLPNLRVLVGMSSSLVLQGGVRLADGGIVSDGGQSISSSANAVVFTPSTSCWTANGDVAFRFSDTFSGNGFRSSAVAADETGPAQPMPQRGVEEPEEEFAARMQQWQTQSYDPWRQRLTEKAQARRVNTSAFECKAS